MPTFAKLHCALHFIFSKSFREWIYKILKGAANLVDGTDYNLKTISLLENPIYFYPFIPTFYRRAFEIMVSGILDEGGPICLNFHRSVQM